VLGENQIAVVCSTDDSSGGGGHFRLRGSRMRFHGARFNDGAGAGCFKEGCCGRVFFCSLGVVSGSVAYYILFCVG